MKRVLSLLLAIVMVFGLIPMAAFAEGNPTISFETTFVDTMTVGDTFTVTGSLANNPGIATMTLSLQWNEDAVKFSGFETEYDEDEEADVLKSDVFGAMATAVNHDLGIIAGARTQGTNTKKNGTLFVANFEIVGSGDLDIALKDADATEFEMANADMEDIAVTFDYSAIENLSVAAPEPVGPAIPDGAPFTAITTDAGAAIAIEQQGNVSFNYADVPYYIVTIPAGATTAYVTAPDQVVMEDYNTKELQATGYAADVGNDWNPLYISYDYEDTADGPKVEIPMNMVGNGMSGEAELCFVEDEDGNLSHAFGIEDSNYTCLGLISFRYGTSSAPVEPEEPTVSEIPEGAAFVDMIARVNGEDKPVTIEVMDDHYKVLVPLGTTAVYVVYDEGVPYVDNFGYAAVRITGVDGVSDDGYSQSTSDGKTTVGLLMKKAPANGAPTTIELISLDYANRTAVGIKKADNSAEDWFSFTYQLSEGEHYAILPEGIGYTASGSPVAKNGYTFSVTIDEGYEATADFAVKVNGETVATAPGNVTVASVTEDLIITVEGVAKIVESTDISVTFDLTGYLGAFSGGMNYVTQSYEMVELTPEVNKKNTLTLKASDNMILQAQAYEYSSLVTGWDIDGTIYNIPTEYTQMSLGDGIELALNTDGYFSLNVETTSPYTAVIKPVLVAIPEGNYHVFLPDADDAYTLTAETYATDGYTFSVAISHGYRATDAFAVKVNGETVATAPGTITLDTVSQNLAITVEGIEMLTYTIDSGFPAFVEDIIKVTNIVVEKEGVESYQWDGDTLTVILSDETAQNASITTNWTIYAKNTYDGATGARFKFNGSNKAISGAEGTNTFPVTTTLVDGAATAEITVEPRNTVQTNRDIIFTPKTFTVNFYVSGKEPAPEPEQPSSNPITEIEVSHPNIEVDETTGTMTMAMVTGASEQINVSTVLENAELDATQVVAWFSSNESVATVVDGKVTALQAGTTVITAKAVDPSGVAAAAEGDEVLAQFTLTVANPAAGYAVNMGEDKTVVANETIQIPVTVTHSDSNVTDYKSFEFTFQYDPTVLTLVTGSSDTEGKEITVTDNNGTITVRRYGNALNVGGAAITLEFTAKKTGNTNVKLTGAKVGTSDDAQNQNIPTAQVMDDITLITVTGYTVSLPQDFAGVTVVAPGESYTFEATDKNYTYEVKATIDGEEITVNSNEDGTSFTIPEGQIDGNVVIEIVKKEGKKFEITLNGESLAHESGYTTEGEKTYAQYMTPYTAKLTKKEHYIYDLKVTVNGETVAHEYNSATGIITIAGNLITGPVVIESGEKESEKHNVEFEGAYASHAKYEGESAVYDGESFSFTIETPEGLVIESYQVSYKMGDATEYTALEAVEDTYTIEDITAALTIKIEGTSDLKVEVNEYVKLNGKVVFLVTATQTLPEGKNLAYNSDVMYLKNFTVDGSDTMAQMYSYLVVVNSGETLSVEDATAMITIVEAQATTLEDTFNVNESSALDINDAQLVYDLYNNVYQDITTVGMQKFLRADVNGSRNINVSDAAAVVNAILAENQ